MDKKLDDILAGVAEVRIRTLPGIGIRVFALIFSCIYAHLLACIHTEL